MIRVCLAALGCLLVVSTANAQTVVQGPENTPAMDDMSEARDRFTAGESAASEGRWSDALAAFRRSYELSGIAAALYNTATTYRSIGRYRLARDTFSQLLREHSDAAESMLQSARELRDEVAARVAVLSLANVPSDDESLRVRVDGRARDDDGARPLDIDVDEGEHTLALDREGYLTFEWEGSVAGGDERRIDVEFVERPRERNTGRIILFVAIGVAVVAGAVTAGFLLRDTGLEPNSEFVIELPDV